MRHRAERCELANLLPRDINRDIYKYNGACFAEKIFHTSHKGESFIIITQFENCTKNNEIRAHSSLLFSGLMMESEKKIFEMMNKKAAMSKYWMPLVWATNIINRARKEALITSDHVVQTLLVELSDIRKRLGALIGYDTVCVPLVYTQVSEILAKSRFNSKARQHLFRVCVYKLLE